MAKKRKTLTFEEWKQRCLKHSSKLLGLDDILAKNDPYDLFEEMTPAFKAQEAPEAFIERMFEEDLARQEHDDQLFNESLEHEISEQEFE